MAYEDTIRLYRGNKSGLPTVLDGEPVWAHDTGELYVGGRYGNVRIGYGITPEAYGAKGDGTTDDTAAIQAAIDAAWAVQGTVVLGPHIYKTGALHLPADDYHTVAIVGVNATGLWQMNEAPSLYFYLTDGTDFITITNPASSKQAFYRFENLNVRGPDFGGATTTSGHGLYMNAANVTATCYFRNVSVNGFYGAGKAGIYLYDAEYSHFDSVDVTQCDYGIYAYTSTNACVFTNVRAQYCRVGVYISGCTNHTWISPTIQGNVEDGLYIYGLDSATFMATHLEDNNTSDTAGKYGMQIVATPALGNNNINFINTYMATANDQIYMNGSLSANASIKFDGMISYGGDPWVTIADGANYGIYFYGSALTTARIVNASAAPIFMQSTTAAYTMDFPAFLGNKHWTHGTTAPASGTWAVGDICYNTTPRIGGTSHWICTMAGTPGVWDAGGIIDQYGNRILNSSFDNLDGWTVDFVNAYCTIASVAGGQAGNCLQITRVSDVTQIARYQWCDTTIGKTYTLSGYVKSGTSGDETFRIQARNSDDDDLKLTVTGTTSDTWTQYSGTFVADHPYIYIDAAKVSATAGTMLFDTISLTETPVFDNMNVTGVYQVDGTQVLGPQAAAEADAKEDYTTGDLDSEAEVIAAINATNTTLNNLLAKLRTHGILAT
jgi:hypothetical protein